MVGSSSADMPMMTYEEIQRVPTYSHCEKHGEYQLNVIAENDSVTWLSQCPVCNREVLAHQMLDRAGIPDRFKTKTLSSFETSNEGQKAALDKAQRYSDDFANAVKLGRCLLFVGPPGVGKTHLACGIANELLQKNYSAAFVSVMEMVKRVRATWKTEENEADVVNYFAGVDLLVLDEVGMTMGTKSEEQILFDVIQKRYEKFKPSLLISNLPLQSSDGASKTVREYLGERVYDRLREGGGSVVTFMWQSERGCL